MSILLELAVNAVASVGMLGGYSAIKNRITRKKDQQVKEQRKKATRPDEWGGWPWEALYSWTERYDLWGRSVAADKFRCPKCKKETGTSLSLCDNDSHYHNPHFHFKCNHCSFTCILRTADDVGEEEEE